MELCPSARVLEEFEDVDVVVNNAGACLTGTFSATAVEDFRAQMDVVSTKRKSCASLETRLELSRPLWPISANFNSCRCLVRGVRHR